MELPKTTLVNLYVIRRAASMLFLTTISICIGSACAIKATEAPTPISAVKPSPIPTVEATATSAVIEPSAQSAVAVATLPSSDNIANTGASTIAKTQEQPKDSIQSEWVRARVDAIIQIWGFTDEGSRWLRNYDLRQMVAEPGWFGSYGFEYWAGAGEAIPRTILHELSHSYWGAFPVVDGELLDWRPIGPDPSEGIQQFRADLNEFLTQPTDRYEPLRDRLRNLPNLTSGDYPDLHHFGEADLIYSTGGNLLLLPPILRKYFSDALSDRGVGPETGGGFTDWGDALGWFMALSPGQIGSDLSDRRVAEETFGIQHFPLSRYSGAEANYLKAAERDPSTVTISPLIRAVIEKEEKQRLLDFADQFHEIKTSHDQGSDFNFWKSYLSQIRDLHSRHSNVLDETQGIATDLAAALEGYVEIKELDAEDQVGWFGETHETPYVSDFAVLLKPRALLSLFNESEVAEGVLSSVGFKAKELALIVEPIDEITSLAHQDPASASAMLDQFLLSMEEDRLRSDAGLILDLIRGSGSDVSKPLLANLSSQTYARIFEFTPSFMTDEAIPVDKALASIGINDNFTAGQFEDGLRLYPKRSSGNFALDIRFEKEIYRLLDALSESDVARAFAALGNSGMRLSPWIESEHSLSMIRRSISHAATIVMDVEGPRENPAGLMHALIRRDPRLAADVAKHIIQHIDPDFGQRILKQMAFDGYWRSKGATFIPAAESARAFLVSLIAEYGDEWFDGQVDAAIAASVAQVKKGKLEHGFETNLRLTLQETMP